MIYDVFNEIFDFLNRQDNHVVIMAVFLCVAAGVVLLRILARLRFSAALLNFRRDAKELKDREDTKKYRNPLMRRIVAAYKQVADKAVTRIPTTQIIERQVETLGVAGWRFAGLAAFVEGFESGLLWVGVILAVVFNDFAHVYGAVTVAVFLVFRVVTALFDFRAARAALCDEIYIYVEREVGRFYASDSGGAVLRLKNELTEMYGKQTEAFTSAILKLTNALTDNAASLNKTIAETTENVHTQIAEAVNEKLVDMDAALVKNCEAWQKALTEATAVQNVVNGSADGIAKASGRLQSAAELLATHMQGHSNALSEQLLQLVRAIDAVKDQQETVVRYSQYIEKNQETLETALNSYEASLKNLAQNLGDSLGAFVNLHAQSSAQAVNDALRGNLERIMQLSQRGETP
jgi:hypothetical protein